MANLKISSAMVWIIILLMISNLTQSIPYCPGQNTAGIVYSQSITIGFGGQLQLIPNQDVQCYNYTMQYQFLRKPGIAIAVNSFSANPSLDLFFSIKPIKNDLTGLIPFIVRTQWKYTVWNQLKFSFLVEDKNNFQAGYFQLDTAWLSGCSISKILNMFIPINSLNTFQIIQNLKSNVFLHGFQISASNYTLSPYELQIINTVTNQTGIIVSVSVTTSTQVHAIHMSYVVYAIDQSIVGGKIQLQTNFKNGRPYNSQSQDYWMSFHGFSGFIILRSGQNGVISFNSVWNKDQFSFNFQFGNNQYQFLSYEYIFFIGNQCQGCSGYPMYYNNSCLNNCPQGTFLNNNKCITCPSGQFWNGLSCIGCPNTQVWDSSQNTCKCPGISIWNGYTCINCQNGQIFNPSSQQCSCPLNQYWTGYSCTSCNISQIWNQNKNTCQCPLNSIWNGTYCVNCPYGQNWNYQTNNCSCSPGQYWNGITCIKCQNNQNWNYTTQKCQCPYNYYWNGNSCISCQQGRTWNPQTQQCSCQNSQFWNGFTCIFCQLPQIYNATTQTCQCPYGRVWNGYSCNDCTPGQQCSCPSSQQWNGQQCISCLNGQIWSSSLNRCSCPINQMLIGYQCVGCNSSMIWNPLSNICQCPINQQWNGYQCSPCSGSKFYDQIQKKCICPNNLQWNGNTCMNCQIGKTWNYQTNQCDCPFGTYWSNNICSRCQYGQTWNPNTQKCECPIGWEYDYYQHSCQWKPINNCPSNKIYNNQTYQCQCPKNTFWNGQNCSINCSQNQIYIGNTCVCPSNLQWNGYNCTSSQQCSNGLVWNGFQCVSTNQCPPGSYWNGNVCIYQNTDQCTLNMYWNGTQCVSLQWNCPNGYQWNGQTCNNNNSSVPNGYYWNGYAYVILEQQCPFGSTWNWNLNRCEWPTNISCPVGYYVSDKACVKIECPYQQSWNSITFQCQCPLNQIWSGTQCISCQLNKILVLGQCVCQAGYFELNNNCIRTNNNNCNNISNSLWNNNICDCLPGYQKVGYSCICPGLILNDYCDNCYYKPRSIWKYGICQCKDGFYEKDGKCEEINSNNNYVNTNSSCNVGNYFHQQQKKCLPCSTGCLSCNSTYYCLQCSQDFNYDIFSKLCIEKCGDGKRYNLQCDDGNNLDFDGCSKFCKIQPGYNCKNGSPNRRDECSKQIPQKIELKNTGQTHTFGKIIINVRTNYLSKELIQKICVNQCKGVLKADIISGDKSASSIKSIYTKGTTYSFGIYVQFGKQPIGAFSMRISIDQSFKLDFQNIDISQSIVVNVQPAYLAKADFKEDYLP